MRGRNIVQKTLLSFHASMVKQADEERKQLNKIFSELFEEEKEFAETAFEPLIKEKSSISGTLITAGSSLVSYSYGFFVHETKTEQPKPESKKPVNDLYCLYAFIRDRRLINYDQLKLVNYCRKIDFQKFFVKIENRINLFIKKNETSKTTYPELKDIIHCVQNDFASAITSGHLTISEQLDVIAEINKNYADKYKYLFDHSAWSDGLYPYRKIFSLALIQIKLNALQAAFEAVGDYITFDNSADITKIDKLYETGDNIVLKKYFAIKKYKEFTVWLKKFSLSEYISPFFSYKNDITKLINYILDFSRIYHYRPDFAVKFEYTITPKILNCFDLITKSIHPSDPTNAVQLMKEHENSISKPIQRAKDLIILLCELSMIVPRFFSEELIKTLIENLISAIKAEYPHTLRGGFFEKYKIYTQGMATLKSELSTPVGSCSSIVVEYLGPKVDDDLDLNKQKPVFVF